MFIVELVMQGVRGIREVARLRFKSGFNFVAARSGAGGRGRCASAAKRLGDKRGNGDGPAASALRRGSRAESFSRTRRSGSEPGRAASPAATAR